MPHDDSEHTGAGALAAVLPSLLIAFSVLALSIRGSALSSTDESPAPQASEGAAPSTSTSSALTSTSSALLEALAYQPAKRDLMDISFEFTDWAALKALHGGADVNSATPLTERQRLMLDIVRSETTAASLGLDRLAIWPERGGWDTRDFNKASGKEQPDVPAVPRRETVSNEESNER